MGTTCADWYGVVSGKVRAFMRATQVARTYVPVRIHPLPNNSRPPFTLPPIRMKIGAAASHRSPRSNARREQQPTPQPMRPRWRTRS